MKLLGPKVKKILETKTEFPSGRMNRVVENEQGNSQKIPTDVLD